AAEREGRISEHEAQIAALSAELAAERRRAAEARDERADQQAVTAEIEALEAALRDRGRRVAQLELDMREAERGGKDMVSELEALRAWNGSGHGSRQDEPGHAAGEDLRGRLDALASSAARSEADLQAAAWRIAQLERELADALRGAREPSSVQVELEEALA